MRSTSNNLFFRSVLNQTSNSSGFLAPKSTSTPKRNYNTNFAKRQRERKRLAMAEKAADLREMREAGGNAFVCTYDRNENTGKSTGTSNTTVCKNGKKAGTSVCQRKSGQNRKQVKLL